MLLLFRYGNATIVFDGYQDGPSTKDATHQSRTGAYAGPAVNFASDMIIKSKKEEFLANKDNKQKFINLLRDKFEAAGCSTDHASGDADLLIVQTAVNSARNNTTVLVGDDTDLLVLLCYHADLNSHDIFFKPEPKQNAKTRRVWDIKKTKTLLGPNVYTNILFVHAVLGCDTTSRLHGIGKGVALKKIKSNANFLEQAKVFSHQAATKEDVVKAGEKALLCLYNAVSEESLNSLRYSRFCQKVATGTTCVQPENLPPTSAAASYHSQRVFFQVQQWKGDELLQPVDWGWKTTDGKLLPIQTHQPPAHNSLLEVIRCNCKTDCNTNRCTCKRHGLDCSAMCGTCRGQGCVNSTEPDLDADLSDED